MYQVLYRKWRSPTFGDVVGQDHVTTTLRRALQAGRLAHAYLFTGPRGTGKTSCARILAKAVNCTALVEGEPCNACELCVGIDNNSILDVIEIDAASNNGVDNIRDLRDETNFTPAHGKYRVYIIDEVHMLSAGAFNALLKTLEEPPSYVIFILATTEVHKLPATVLSRCQRFDFHRISAEDIAQRLLHVAAGEGLALEEGAAMLLARVADGAMRDALSLLDRCRTEGESITAASVAKAIGMADRRYLFELCDALLSSDIGACLQLIHQLYHDACEMERLCEEMLVHMRNLLVLRSVKTPREFLLCTEEDLALYQAQAKLCTVPQLLKYMEVLEQTQQNLRRSTDRRMEMELGLIRLCTMGQDATPTVAASRATSPGSPQNLFCGVVTKGEAP
ncbi:MAG: DNA polymerase III subunit gamma/tau, partial [Oscillospiraceae bacterium]|nr:DNA polymerase III subunit gamma/tau [Oscillospiraceae bacterium]